MAEVKIGNTLVGDGYPCFIIAEIGINHNGDLNLAKKLIDVAVEAGCNAVKFQKRTVDVVYTKEELARPRENPFGPTNGDLKRGLEFGVEQYREIDAYCREKRILWELPAGMRRPSISSSNSTSPSTRSPRPASRTTAC